MLDPFRDCVEIIQPTAEEISAHNKIDIGKLYRVTSRSRKSFIGWLIADTTNDEGRWLHFDLGNGKQEVLHENHIATTEEISC